MFVRTSLLAFAGQHQDAGAADRLGEIHIALAVAASVAARPVQLHAGDPFRKVSRARLAALAIVGGRVKAVTELSDVGPRRLQELANAGVNRPELFRGHQTAADAGLVAD